MKTLSQQCLLQVNWLNPWNSIRSRTFSPDARDIQSISSVERWTIHELFKMYTVSIERSSSNFAVLSTIGRATFAPRNVLPLESEWQQPFLTALSLARGPSGERKVSTPAGIELAISRRACRFFLLKRLQIRQRLFFFLFDPSSNSWRKSCRARRNRVCLSSCFVETRASEENWSLLSIRTGEFSLFRRTFCFAVATQILGSLFVRRTDFWLNWEFCETDCVYCNVQFWR